MLSSGHLSPYQLHSLTPQADGRLGTALSEFYAQLPLLIAHISYYLKNKKKQQQPVTWVSQCPHHKFPASGPAHHPQLTGKKETQRRQDARTYTVTTSVPGTKGAASNKQLKETPHLAALAGWPHQQALLGACPRAAGQGRILCPDGEEHIQTQSL